MLTAVRNVSDGSYLPVDMYKAFAFAPMEFQFSLYP